MLGDPQSGDHLSAVVGLAGDLTRDVSTSVAPAFASALVSATAPTTAPLMAMLAEVEPSVFFLTSFVKPTLILGTLIPYCWIASKVEADTRKYLLPIAMWNGILVGAAVVGLLAALLIPIFWAGWPVMIMILAGTMWGYWQYRDKRVPANAKFQIVSEGLRKSMEDRKAKKAIAESTIKFFTPSGKPFPVPQRETPEHAVHMSLEAILEPALSRRVSRLDLVATAPQQPLVPIHSIDGVRAKAEAISPQAAVEAIDYLKKIAGLNLDDRRRKQTAEIKMSGPTRDVSATVSVWGSSAGPALRVDFDRAKSLQVSFDSLGLLPQQSEALKAFLDTGRRHGVMLISALPGQGLTTTAYSLLGRHDAYTCNIKTLEKNVELQLEGVDHAQFNPSNPTVDFATNLQSILRRDPDIVFVSEVTDPNAGRIASNPGIAGPLIYVGIPAESVGAAVSEWFRAVGDLKAAAKGIVGVTHQRLIRKVCEACRQPLQPTPDLLKRIGVPQGKSVNLFRANGKVQVKNRVEDCPVCQGTGFFGMSACFEVMIVDETMRQMLAEGDFKAAYAHARREGRLIQLQEAAMAKVRDGITTVEELVRVFPPPKQTVKS
jgi:type II secretory ATPase GspE/PulE/Tfp pilus assembly ATPase PilB-like protein